MELWDILICCPRTCTRFVLGWNAHCWWGSRSSGTLSHPFLVWGRCLGRPERNTHGQSSLDHLFLTLPIYTKEPNAKGCGYCSSFQFPSLGWAKQNFFLTLCAPFKAMEASVQNFSLSCLSSKAFLPCWLALCKVPKCQWDFRKKSFYLSPSALN